MHKRLLPIPSPRFVCARPLTRDSVPHDSGSTLVFSGSTLVFSRLLYNPVLVPLCSGWFTKPQIVATLGRLNLDLTVGCDEALWGEANFDIQGNEIECDSNNEGFETPVIQVGFWSQAPLLVLAGRLLGCAMG